MVLVLVLGALYRLVPFIRNPSLIVDDAMLALNVATRSFGGLLRPLSLEQTAPPGFLWALKAFTVVLGVNEFALRALPLIAGVILPYAVWRLARRILDAGPALLAAAVAAFSPILLQYSITAKPYVVDALAAVIVLQCALTVLDHPDESRGWWRLVGAGAGALLFSTPAVFVLAGVAVALALSQPRRPRLAVAAGVWGAVFAAIYFNITRPESATPYMRSFWAARFIPPSTWPDPGVVWNVVKRLPAGTLMLARGTSEPTLLFWALGTLGMWRLAGKRRDVAVLLVTPIGVILAAAALSLYPISPRVDLFAAPIGFLLFGAALGWTEDLGGLARVGARTLAVLFVAGLAWLGVKTDPWAPGLRSVTQAAMGEQPVYIYSAAIPAWAFYSTDWTHPDTARLRDIIGTQGADGEAFHNAPGRGRAVSDTEGDGLAVSSGGRRELLGLAPGIQYREGAMFSQAAPDPGWASHEARRIRGAGPTVWVVLAPGNSPVVRELLDTLKGLGARSTAVRIDHQAALYQLQFSP